MNEDFFDRLDKYIEYKGLNDNKITVQAGIPVGSLGKQRKGSRGLSVQSIAKLLYTYSDLNAEWLLTGNGSMIKNVIAEKETKNTDIQIKPLADLLTHMHTEVVELTSKLSMQISKNEILMRENEILHSKIEKLKEKGPPEGLPDNRSDRRVHSINPNFTEK